MFKLIFLININLQEKLKLNMLQKQNTNYNSIQNIQVLQAIHIIQLITKKFKTFAKYKKLINIYEKKNIFFEGRLAQYKYLNMDEVIERALNLFNRIKLKFN